MTAKKKTESKVSHKEAEALISEENPALPLTQADYVEALKDALGSDYDHNDVLASRHYYYTSDAVVEVKVSKRALRKGEDPREP